MARGREQRKAEIEGEVLLASDVDVKFYETPPTFAFISRPRFRRLVGIIRLQKRPSPEDPEWDLLLKRNEKPFTGRRQKEFNLLPST
jgi:hypothetical protein